MRVLLHTIQMCDSAVPTCRAVEAAEAASDLRGAGTTTTNPFVLDLEEEEAVASGCGA